MGQDTFLAVTAFVAIGMLTWDCVEVGRNDAANLVNAVFGARVMKRRSAVYLAGAAVVLGATFASPVMETTRKGIFDPTQLPIQAAIAVYITAYLVDTVLLFTYSAFGMPVSTTATLVFSLVGGGIGVAAGLDTVGFDLVSWSKVGTVVAAIVVSIILSGIAGFLIQRAFRGAIGENSQDPWRVRLHGPWIAGLMMTWLVWFMLMKGLKGVAAVEAFNESFLEVHGVFPFLVVLWGGLTLVVYGLIVWLKDRGTTYLFHFTAVLGMLCMAFAFGQNDLANCASPGLSSWWLYQHRAEGVAVATEVEIWRSALFVCGLLMAMGMTTRTAQRVTRCQVNTGSQFDRVAIWSPNWCRAIARGFIKDRREGMDIAPPSAMTETGKRIHYDTLRASVIMAVSASVIAFASGKGLPVSTTYVGFAAIVATGWGDRVFIRGDADRKLGRAIWVVTAWFLAALIAVVASSFVAFAIFKFGFIGLGLGLAANLTTRFYFKARANRHEEVHHKAHEGDLRQQEGEED